MTDDPSGFREDDEILEARPDGTLVVKRGGRKIVIGTRRKIEQEVVVSEIVNEARKVQETKKVLKKNKLRVVIVLDATASRDFKWNETVETLAATFERQQEILREQGAGNLKLEAKIIYFNGDGVHGPSGWLSVDGLRKFLSDPGSMIVMGGTRWMQALSKVASAVQSFFSGAPDAVILMGDAYEDSDANVAKFTQPIIDRGTPFYAIWERSYDNKWREVFGPVIDASRAKTGLGRMIEQSGSAVDMDELVKDLVQEVVEERVVVAPVRRDRKVKQTAVQDARL